MLYYEYTAPKQNVPMDTTSRRKILCVSALKNQWTNSYSSSVYKHFFMSQIFATNHQVYTSPQSASPLMSEILFSRAISFCRYAYFSFQWPTVHATHTIYLRRYVCICVCKYKRNVLTSIYCGYYIFKIKWLAGNCRRCWCWCCLRYKTAVTAALN